MWDTYEEYCEFFRSRNMEPLSEEIFDRDYRRKPEQIAEYFANAEEYFDYIEAQQILKEIRELA